MYESLIKSKFSHDYADEFSDLLYVCVQLNLCYFNGETYIFQDGLPMGGPLSSLLANVYMDRLEHWILKHGHFVSRVIA